MGRRSLLVQLDTGRSIKRHIDQLRPAPETSSRANRTVDDGYYYPSREFARNKKPAAGSPSRELTEDAQPTERSPRTNQADRITTENGQQPETDLAAHQGADETTQLGEAASGAAARSTTPPVLAPDPSEHLNRHTPTRIRRPPKRFGIDDQY